MSATRLPAAGQRPSTAWAACVAAAALAASSCSTYVGKSLELRRQVASGNVDAAFESLEPLAKGGSRLLYLYERGLILHQEDRFVESNAALEEAEKLLDDLYTRSVSREIAALFTNDAVVEYRGQRFEAAILHYYRTLNFLYLGDLENAAVECRRLDHRLQVFHDTGGSFYRSDPFLTYVSGLVRAAAGEPGEADVSLRNALADYLADQARYDVEIPGVLLCDLARNATRLGASDEAAEYAKEGGCEPPADGSGSVTLFLECGGIAYKDQTEILLPIYKTEITENLDAVAFASTLASRRGWQSGQKETVKVDYILRVAFPILVPTPSGIAMARVEAFPAMKEGVAQRPVQSCTTVRAANWTKLAQESFAEDEAAIFLRATARALLKYLAKREAEKKHGEPAGWLMNALGFATETADTRCWSTLPEQVLLARFDLPPGTYRLAVGVQGRDGAVDLDFDIPEVVVRAGQNTFLSHRVY